MQNEIHELGIDQLSVAKRIELVQDIWDSVAASVQAAPLAAQERDELERRWQEDTNFPQAAEPWPSAQAGLAQKWSRR